jgi:hypothetical protein
MAKSFLEYVENRIVENFDYNEAANQINTVISEQGHITPEQLHEILAPAWVSALARKAGGAMGAARSIGGKLASDAASKVGSSFANVTKDTLGAIGKVAGKGMDYVADKAAKVAQYGSDVSKAGELGYEYGHGREGMRQKMAALGHEKAAAQRLQGMGGIGSQEAGQRVGQVSGAMQQIQDIMKNLSREDQARLYADLRARGNKVA